MNTKKEDLAIFEQEQGELILFVKTHDLTNQENYKKFEKLQDINMEIMKLKLEIKEEEKMLKTNNFLSKNSSFQNN